MFNVDFKPALLEGQTARLLGSNLPAGGLNVECISGGAIPELYEDFGALTAATWATDKENTELEMNTMELGQFRMRIIDDFKVRMQNPGSVDQWRTKSARGYLPQMPVGDGMDFYRKFLWAASEFFVWEK